MNEKFSNESAINQEGDQESVEDTKEQIQNLLEGKIEELDLDEGLLQDMGWLSGEDDAKIRITRDLKNVDGKMIEIEDWGYFEHEGDYIRYNNLHSNTYRLKLANEEEYEKWRDAPLVKK